MSHAGSRQGASGGYGLAALRAEAAKLRATGQGQPGPEGNPARPGRNAQLNRAAFRLGQLVHAGLLDQDLVRAELLAAAAAAGLGPREALATIASGLAGAARKPPTTAARRALLG